MWFGVKTLAMSLFLILAASVNCFPLIHSVARLDEKMDHFWLIVSTWYCEVNFHLDKSIKILRPGRGDGRAATKGLELGIHNLSIIVNLHNTKVTMSLLVRLKNWKGGQPQSAASWHLHRLEHPQGRCPPSLTWGPSCPHSCSRKFQMVTFNFRRVNYVFNWVIHLPTFLFVCSFQMASGDGGGLGFRMS